MSSLFSPSRFSVCRVVLPAVLLALGPLAAPRPVAGQDAKPSETPTERVAAPSPTTERTLEYAADDTVAVEEKTSSSSTRAERR